MSGEGEARAQAAEAARGIAAAREIEAQLSMFAEPEPPAEAEGKRGPGRPAGSKNKSKAQLRDWMAAQGYRMPETTLVQLAALDRREGLVQVAMERAETFIAWAREGAGAASFQGPGAAARQSAWDNWPSPAQRLEILFTCLSQASKAAEALLPYGLAKMTPEINADGSPVFVVMPGAAAAQPGDGARVVDVRASRPSNYAPPPMPGEIEGNQEVSGAPSDASDDGSRTE